MRALMLQYGLQLRGESSRSAPALTTIRGLRPGRQYAAGVSWSSTVARSRAERRPTMSRTPRWRARTRRARSSSWPNRASGSSATEAGTAMAGTPSGPVPGIGASNVSPQKRSKPDIPL
ncbi:hypothetical protein ACFQ2Y_42860 [Streptomyces malaysiensis subsp. malaysiensis]